jgi:GNAT superfamily N-acetyltransferase
VDKVSITQVRDAIAKDVDEITKLYIKSVQTHFKGTLPDEELVMWKYENEKQKFMNQIADKTMRIRILQADNGELIGFTRFGVDPDNSKNGNLESIFVKDIYHIRKYGTLLFKDAQSELLAMGFNHMILWTPTKGTAHGFYQKLGGTKCGQKINEIHFDLTAYSWRLTTKKVKCNV